MDSPPDQRENNATATGTTGRFAGASFLPVPVMAAPIVLEKVYRKLKLGAFRVSGKFLQDRGIQGESADLIIQAWRQSTKKQYESNQKLVRCSIFNIQHSNFECRISNIKLNPTFKSNVEYRISNSIQYSNRMSNIEYQTQSNIQIECRISNIKLNPTFKSNVEYRISNSISHSNFECRISNIKLNPTFKSNVEYRISN